MIEEIFYYVYFRKKSGKILLIYVGSFDIIMFDRRVVMKFKIKFQNVFIVLSILFIFGCICFYGYRLVKYYKIFNPKTDSGEKTEIISVTIRKDNPVITEGDGLYI